MTSATKAKLPSHLRRYIVEQNYARYTAEDQATWRFVMRQLKNFLSVHAHESYLDGLEKTGLNVEKIPRIDDIDEHLEPYGWGAVPVSGFIPPAAFMEFQSIGVLPIASDMRTMDHIQYTPAPDIVHEAAGHAPFIVHTEYSKYLRQYGDVARHSILSKEDLDQYEAIRVLSDIKEDPRSTADDVARAEKRLAEVNASLRVTSEAALLSRMNWWTAEYGLVGDLHRPRIFGAGLLSSVGESRAFMDPKVKKIPLSVNCINYSYDITEQQPQLFVARDFGHLCDVLEDLAAQLSYRRGGIYGLERAREARTVNSVQLDSGIQIGGVLEDFILDDQKQPAYLQFRGPSQLALNKLEIEGQGTAQHPQGYSTPVGRLKSDPTDRLLGLKVGEAGELNFASGVKVTGTVTGFRFQGEELVLVSWKNCRVNLGGKVLFDPSWGDYDMAVGSSVVSVFGGAPDRERFGTTEDFVAKLVPSRQLTPDEARRHQLFGEIRRLRENSSADQAALRALIGKYLAMADAPWLAGIELLELGRHLGLKDLQSLESQLDHQSTPSARECVRDGMAIAGLSL